MGRKRKYHTEKERREAQRRWQMEHYRRNSEKIKQKAREKYRKQKRNELYDKKVSETFELMIAKNHDYGEAWRDMRISSLTDLIIQKLLKDKSHLKNILKKGSEKANIIAEENLKNIREKVGLI